MLIARHRGIEVRHDVAGDGSATLEAEVAATVPAADVVVGRLLEVLHAAAWALDQHHASDVRVQRQRLLDAPVLLR